MKKYLFIALALLLAACEKPVLDEDIASTREANVILHMTQFEQESFGTRAATDITELCSRLNVAIFDADGTKVKTVAQKEGDTGYGTVALTLAAGTYQLVVIAHNGEGSATITSTEKVTFPNNKVTDTFYYYGDLVVTDAKQSYDLTLTRAVAMFRLVLTDDEIPSTVTKFKFYYTGGSSTFSPKGGRRVVWHCCPDACCRDVPIGGHCPQRRRFGHDYLDGKGDIPQQQSDRHLLLLW